MVTPHYRRIPSSFDGDDSDSETSLAGILQYIIRSGEVRISGYKDDSEEDYEYDVEEAPEPACPDTEELSKSEITLFTKQSAGLISHPGRKRPEPVPAMVCCRERGMKGTLAFSKADRCKINNYFLPNKSTVVGYFSTKLFCGLYLNNGNTFLSASQDRLIRLFDTTQGRFKLIKAIPAKDVGWSILDVGISPDENFLAYGGWCESLQLCKLWENSDCQDALLLCSDERKFCIFSLKFSANGKEIVCGANDSYIYVYDLERNQRVVKILGHDDDVNAVSFADDKSDILYSGGDDGICKVWDRRTLSECRPKPVGCLAGHMLGITYVEPRGDGRHLVTNSKDQSIKLWDVRKFSSEIGINNTKKAVTSQNWDYRWRKVPQSLKNPDKRLKGDTSVMTYCGHFVLKTLSRCHFSPAATTGQRYIYASCAGGRVIVYDVLTGKIAKELQGHRGCVRDAAWHPNRPEIMSTSWDGRIVRWTYQESKWISDEEELEKKRKLHENLKRRSQRIADRKAKMDEST